MVEQLAQNWKHYALAEVVVVAIAWVSEWLWLARQAWSDAIIIAPSMTGATAFGSGVSGWEGLPRIMLTCARRWPWP